MSIFDERESRNEAKFVLDAKKEFQSEARRNKKLGLWAGGILGHEGEDLDKYVVSVIASDMEEAGDEDVFRKLRKDLDTADTRVSDTEIREKMAFFLNEAREEIYTDLPNA